MNLRRIFDFPNPVNESSARVVAGGVVAQAVAFLVLRDGWILAPLVYGFLARVLTGPTASPLGWFSVRVATPFIERRWAVVSRRVPGPPKRFAQLIGLVFSAGAGASWALGAHWFAYVLIAGLAVAASLEAGAAICLGCIAYAAIWGCDDCSNITERLHQAAVRSRESVDVRGGADVVDVGVPTP